MKNIFKNKNNFIIRYIYNEVDEMLGFEYSGSKYYYVKNILGNVEKLLEKVNAIK